MSLVSQKFIEEYKNNIEKEIPIHNISNVWPTHVYIAKKQDDEDNIFCEVEGRYLG